jgi:hypothetical protein
METWAGPEPFAATLAASAGDDDTFRTAVAMGPPAFLRWLRVVAPDGAEDLASDV